MRLKTKMKDLDAMIFNLSHDCNEYLQEINGGKNGFLYRGVRTISPKQGLSKHKSHIEDGRIPVAASNQVHDLYNKASQKVFEWKFRDGISTTSAIAFVDRNFGTPRIFLPIGDYKFVYSPVVSDFNDQDLVRLYYNAERHISDEFIELYNIDKKRYSKELFNFTVELLIKHYKDDNIKLAIKEKVEVSFNCQYYYLVTDEPLFVEALKEGGWT